MSGGPSTSDQMWRQSLQQGLARTRVFVWFLLKTILPTYIIMEILKFSGAIQWIAGFLHPVMGIWGLPGEAAAALAAGFLVSLYATAAVVASLGLTPAQITVLGVILCLAHSLPVEGALIRQLLPGSFFRVTLLRLALGLSAGWVMAGILR